MDKKFRDMLNEPLDAPIRMAEEKEEYENEQAMKVWGKFCKSKKGQKVLREIWNKVQKKHKKGKD